MLLMQFQDAPEAGEGDDAKDDADVLVRDEQRSHDCGNARQQEGWPALTSEVVFSLDDQGVEHPYAQECRKADDDAGEIHNYGPSL